MYVYTLHTYMHTVQYCYWGQFVCGSIVGLAWLMLTFKAVHNENVHNVNAHTYIRMNMHMYVYKYSTYVCTNENTYVHTHICTYEHTYECAVHTYKRYSCELSQKIEQLLIDNEYRSRR